MVSKNPQVTKPTKPLWNGTTSETEHSNNSTVNYPSLQTMLKRIGLPEMQAFFSNFLMFVDFLELRNCCHPLKLGMPGMLGFAWKIWNSEVLEFVKLVRLLEFVTFLHRFPARTYTKIPVRLVFNLFVLKLILIGKFGIYILTLGIFSKQPIFLHHKLI